MTYRVTLTRAALRDRGSLPSLYRVRVGDYRIVYQIAGGELPVLVVGVGHRSAAYR